jgi:hypothetical protein
VVIAFVPEEADGLVGVAGGFCGSAQYHDMMFSRIHDVFPGKKRVAELIEYPQTHC